jgi:3'-5' exonuclease
MKFTPVSIWTDDASTKNVIELLSVDQILNYKDQ